MEIREREREWQTNKEWRRIWVEKIAQEGKKEEGNKTENVDSFLYCNIMYYCTNETGNWAK